MNTDPVLTAALIDVASIKKWCSANSATQLPESAVAYLCANGEALVFLLATLDSTTPSQRAALQAAYPKLDYSVINDEKSLAESALIQSCQWVSGNKLTPVLDDDVNMLLRALEYVAHLESRPCPIQLEMSPIDLP